MRFLAVGAHPDDLEFNAAGIMLQLLERGYEGGYLICTDGAKGSKNVEDGPFLKEKRRDEQREAAKVLGVKSVFFLDYVDGELVPDLHLRKDIVRVIRSFKPDIVLTWDPTSPWVGDYTMNHPDHLAVGQETSFAVYPSARDNLMFPDLYEEGLSGHITAEIWLFGTNHPNFFVDVSSVFAEKLTSLQRHVSQMNAKDIERSLATRQAWLVRDFANPVTKRLMEVPQQIEFFRRVQLEPIEDLVSNLKTAWQVGQGRMSE